MILILTNRRDVTTDFVVAALRARNVPYVRLNTEDLLRAWKITWTPSGWTMADSRGRRVDSERITGIYYRRPCAPHPVDGTADSAGPFVTREGSVLLRGLITDTTATWISSPLAIDAAEDKLLQMREAQRIGLAIPRTLITNIPEQARAFLASVDAAITKPLSSGHLCDEPPQLAYTSELNHTDELRDIALAPHFIQERIAKVADVRVSVIEARTFACRIESQDHAETSLDWRRGTAEGIQLQHTLVTLPCSVEKMCIELVRRLGLRFGAIDLIERNDGYTFLEINPNGQWAWVQQRTGAPIADALVDALLSNNRSIAA